MGDYFTISFRYNKQKAGDFGLIERDKDSAIDPTDGSVWIKTSSYDFGWGKENGYYKYPLPDFSKLLNLVLFSSNDEDIYGAASVITEKYSHELLILCETLITDSKRRKELKKLTKVFKLDTLINRSNVLNKTSNEINSDFDRWKRICCIAKKL